jgi:hypothetical protein
MFGQTTTQITTQREPYTGSRTGRSLLCKEVRLGAPRIFGLFWQDQKQNSPNGLRVLLAWGNLAAWSRLFFKPRY